MHITQWVFRAEQIRGNKIALQQGEQSFTWSEAADRIRRTAGALAGQGLGKDDAIAILGQNSIEYFEALFAIPLMGGVVVPANIRWAVPELAYSFQDSNTQAILFDKAFLDTADELRKQDVPIKHYIYIGAASECPDWAKPLATQRDAAEPMTEIVHADQNIAGIFYTGGTTGFPKGVIQTHVALFASTIGVVAAIDATEDSIYLHAAPMFHMADLCGNFAYTILAARHVFIPAFEPKLFLQTVQEKKVTDGLIVPAMIQMVFDHPEFSADRIPTLGRLYYGGSPMSEGLVRRVIGAMPNLKLYQLYGQTELAPLATILRPEDHVTEGDAAKRLRSAGRVGSPCQLKIVAEDGSVQPQGEVGEICVTGPNTMLGYLNKPEETERALQNGWVHTGDAGYLDEDGYLFIVDRTKDMIVSGGENVFSSEVESVVSTHPSVLQVAVVGVPDDKWGEGVHAIVIPKPDAEQNAEDIIAHCKKMIAGYKCPKTVEFRTEPFPLSGAGKVLKRELRAKYWEGRERSVN